MCHLHRLTHVGSSNEHAFADGEEEGVPLQNETSDALIARFRSARRDAGLAVLEGFHPLKHALRFGAAVGEVVTADRDRLAALAAALAPELVGRLRELAVRAVSREVFDELAPVPPREPVIAIARRSRDDVEQALAAAANTPVVYLERPSHLGNIGACVRVAAAARAAAVLTTGMHDPWHPAALRGSAGLHYALPVARVAGPPIGARPLIALHPDGEPLPTRPLPRNAVLAFGSERRGLSAELLESAERRVAIPMRAGVSSLSLATAVAVALYAQRS